MSSHPMDREQSYGRCQDQSAVRRYAVEYPASSNNPPVPLCPGSSKKRQGALALKFSD